MLQYDDAAGERCETSSENSPALVDVGASDGIRHVKRPQIINFNYLDAASVVVERFCSLWGQKQNKKNPEFSLWD